MTVRVGRRADRLNVVRVYVKGKRARSVRGRAAPRTPARSGTGSTAETRKHAP